MKTKTSAASVVMLLLVVSVAQWRPGIAGRPAESSLKAVDTIVLATNEAGGGKDRYHGIQILLWLNDMRGV